LLKKLVYVTEGS